MLDKKYLSFIAVSSIFALALIFCGSSFAQQTQGEAPVVKKKMTASQIAFIVKFDKNEDFLNSMSKGICAIQRRTRPSNHFNFLNGLNWQCHSSHRTPFIRH